MTGKRAALTVLAVLLAVFGLALINPDRASAQSAVVLTPSSDVNQVGTPHTVTATVSGCGFFNPNCAGERVTFFVFGGGNPNPTFGSATTDSLGQATFTFTNFVVSINGIQASAGLADGFASKQWIAGPARTMTLFPPVDTNPVGTPHTVTATVRDQFGNPVPLDLINFTVTGDGTPTPPSGINFTNTSGQATFTFTNTVAGTNTITARDSFGLTATATKTWVAGAPARLTLSPPADTNPVGTQHCVTATVTDQFGNPLANVLVRFFVTGSVNTTGSANTNASGQATFCYFGPILPGADAIRAYADTNRNNMQDPGEPAGTATKTWVLPVSTPGCEVKITNGGWIIAANGDKSTFGGNAKVDEDGNASGNEEYQDHGPAQPMNVHGNVLVVVCTSTTEAMIFGQATVDGVGPFYYRINVEDNDEPGKDADTYWITVGNGYDSGDQTLRGGNVQIHQN